MARMRKGQTLVSPATLLEQLTQNAVSIAKTARKHRQKLNSENFYANKLSTLRAEAVNAFRDLSTQSAGDVTAMAEMIEAVFSPQAEQAKRAATARELIFSLRTTWSGTQPAAVVAVQDALFPPTLIAQTKRGYLITICRQMNECYAAGWYDACAVMMRRLVEIVIIEAFEHVGQSTKIKDTNGNYLQLTDLIGAALVETSLPLSRNARSSLPQMRDIGHMSAHGRYFTAQKDDIVRVRQGSRIVIEEFLRHASLL